MSEQDSKTTQLGLSFTAGDRPHLRALIKGAIYTFEQELDKRPDLWMGEFELRLTCKPLLLPPVTIEEQAA